MSTNTFSPTFKMSGTSFIELSRDLIDPESHPADYVDGLYSYSALFNDPAIGELVWRITQANTHRGTGSTWQAIDFNDLLEAMRVEPLDPMTSRRRLDYAAFGIMRAHHDDWMRLMEIANRDLVNNRDLVFYFDHYLYPSAKLLDKMQCLRRNDV